MNTRRRIDKAALVEWISGAQKGERAPLPGVLGKEIVRMGPKYYVQDGVLDVQSWQRVQGEGQSPESPGA